MLDVLLANRELVERIYPETKQFYETLKGKVSCRRCKTRSTLFKIRNLLRDLPTTGRDLSCLDDSEVPPRLKTLLTLSDRVRNAEIKAAQGGKAIREGTREACVDCMRKHIAQALVLLKEVRKGCTSEKGELHFWYAVGHLAEAEDEIVGVDVKMAQRIRRIRLGLVQQEEAQGEENAAK